MAWTVATFKTRYAEFGTAPNALVSACLAEAYSLLNSCAFGNNYDTAVGYLAADTLARSPFGRSQALAPDGESDTIYMTKLKEIKKGVIPNMIVV